MLDHVADRLVHRQRGTGKRAVGQSRRGAVERHADRLTDRAAFPRDRVGDEHDPACTLRAEDDRDGRGMDVDEVGDDRDGESVVRERGADEAGLAVVQRTHPVEAVRDEPRAGVGRVECLFVGRGRVSERHQHAARGQRLDAAANALSLPARASRP